jgi:ferritin-like metal-binding protein YciE
MNQENVTELLLQALETEQGGVKVYETAVQCAINPELRKEWEEYLGHTREHVEHLLEVFQELGIDPAMETPGRLIARHIGESLVEAMQMARDAGLPEAAQIVAAECVVHAETKDHLDWELLGEIARSRGQMVGKDAIRKAVAEVEEEEDEHLYHTQGWTRELWIERLGMPAVLPPPEEEKDVKTAIGAARAKKARKEMV